MHTKNKTVIIIAGPTAVGKTSVAIALAKKLGTEIISADSRQCYKEMKIGVARPSDAELEAVKHYFIASHSIQQKVTAATFEAYALEKVNILFQQHDTVVMVGGTGLYIKAFCEGLDSIPEIPEALRNKIVTDYNEHGFSWLQNRVATLDPQFYASGEIQNPHRLLRALEVVEATGQSILYFRKGIKQERPFRIVKLALHLPKEQLHHNINYRVDQMMEQGLLKEVEDLVPFQHLSALQTVGYREIFDFLNGNIILPQAIEAIKKNTRQYAKRQLTWFKKDPAFQWFEPTNLQAIFHYLQAV